MTAACSPWPHNSKSHYLIHISPSHQTWAWLNAFRLKIEHVWRWTTGEGERASNQSRARVTSYFHGDKQNSWKSPSQKSWPAAEEAESAEAAVWCGGHTHRSLLVVSSSSSSSSSPPPHALVRVTHRKRGSEGMRSNSAGNEASKHHGEGVAGRRDTIKNVWEDNPPVYVHVCLCVCALVGHFVMTHFHSVCTRPQNVIFTVHQTLNSIYSALWEFMASSPHNGPPDCTLLFTHITTSSTTSLTSAAFNHRPSAAVKQCISREPISGERFTAKTTESGF